MLYFEGMELPVCSTHELCNGSLFNRKIIYVHISSNITFYIQIKHLYSLLLE